MPTYVTLAKWTEQGVKGVKDTVTRIDQNRAAIEKLGGRVIGTWWTQGSYDVVAVTEWPDDESASAYMLAIGMSGVARTETLRGYTAEEMQRILQKLP
jgi:uncharacterized protein with GYD domain